MAPQAPPESGTPPSTWPAVARAVLVLTAAVSVLLVAFAWPSVRSSVHGVPIAVAGPPAAAERVGAALERGRPGAFEVTRVADTAAAERLIRDREVYGAIDVTSGKPQVITASAGAATVAQTLQGVATALGQAQGQRAHPAPGVHPAPGTGTTVPVPGTGTGADTTVPVPVRDLVALPADDPRGAGLAAGALPLVMGGLLAAVLLTRLVSGTARRVVGALAFAVTGGLAVTAILQFWFGSLSGSYAANSGAVALAVAATSLTVIGLVSLLGYAGLGIGAATMMLVGNPLSGTGTAPEMLPGWSGALGQLMPPGAGSWLLRSTAFFDGQGAARSVVVLLAWLALGALLCLAGAVRARRTSPTGPSPVAA
ncbi:ABC transporter permease [Streptomyces sp. enrichment culture]|uniref:ABC transporter permease n=1 Tax=Streptomyces sp. enrichment culture TaxID=1795815 RepID=UPI003F5787D2